MKLPMKFRDMEEGDTGLVFKSWLKCFRDSSKSVRGVKSAIYFEHHHEKVSDILDRSRVIMAVSDEDPNQVFGYAVIETTEKGDVMHFAYVKATFRRMGVFRAIMKELGTIPSFYTHDTWISEALAEKYKIIYNPYLI